MITQMTIGGIVVDVALKDIKNVYLRVCPPSGRVRISAPRRMSLDTIRAFAVSRLDWIRQKRRNFPGRVSEAPRKYLDCEHHYVWGKRYRLAVSEQDRAPSA